MRETVISARGLGKRYRIGAAGRPEGLRHLLDPRRALRRRRDAAQEFWALRDVSFDVRRGECVGVVGRNGAGKSTLLKILSRIADPTEGEVRVRGRVGSLLEVGTGFHPELTGRENIFLNGSVLGMSRGEVARKFDEIVAFAEIETFLDTPVKYYSSGMHTRLGFAVAAHLETDILLVDEVLAVGDVQFQKKCVGKMGAVASEGRTVLFVSHNLGLLVALCTTGLFLDGGRLVPTASLAECIERYTNVAVVTGREWTGAAGNDQVRIVRAGIRADGVGDVFSRGEKFAVEVEYEVLDPALPALVLGIEVYDQKNQLLCHSFLTETLEGPSLAAAKARGRHRAAVWIDTALFAEGHYFVKFDLGLHARARLVVDEVLLHFTISVDRFNGFARGSFKPNTIVPPWEWEWQALGGDEKPMRRVI
jgi:lipopolysaccharide transport system ATP-binding protein